MTLMVAIIGSGPAGYYTAEALTKALGDRVKIDIIDRLPTPYGLIRAGVAPDHQSIKGVSRRFESTNALDNVRFVGNVEIGRDFSIDDLQGLYDAVVLATGAPGDRPFEIPGADKKGVIGSSRVVSWYNAHPDFADLDIDLDINAVAVIGNGNVAIDVARVLAKTATEMAQSDLAPHAAAKIHASKLRDIHVIGRRGPLQASFTPKELGEMNELADAVTVMDPADLPELPADADTALKKNFACLEAFAANRPGTKRKTVHMRFFARPVEVLGDDTVTGLMVERCEVRGELAVGTGETYRIDCGLIVPCIGFRSHPIPGVPYDTDGGRFVNDEGRIAPGLYAAGWARRGPTGTIGTNRPDGYLIAEKINADCKPTGKPGRAGLDRLAVERGVKIVTFRDWKKIEAAEISQAVNGAPRVKIASKEALLDAATRGE